MNKMSNKDSKKQPAGFMDWLIKGTGTVREDWTPVNEVLEDKELKENIESVNPNFFKSTEDQTKKDNN